MNLILVFLTVITIFAVIMALFTQIKSNRRIEAFYTRDMQCFERQNDIVSNLEEYSNLQDHLLFLLSDLMHDEKIFDNFSNKEITQIFLEARMLTKDYTGSPATKERLESFIQMLEENPKIREIR
jgi:hypothetical protein